jgi:hypothetical protein
VESKGLFVLEGVLEVHICHAWSWDNPYAFRKRGYEVQFRVNFWADVFRDIIFGRFVLSGSLNVNL